MNSTDCGMHFILSRFKGSHAGFSVLLPGCMLLALLIVSGCNGDIDAGLEEKVLIRAGSSVVTVRAFHEAFESGITSPSHLFQDTEALRHAKYRVLNRLAEELVIMARAGELGLEVGDDELKQAVADFKKDYPDDTFETTLMENGISYLNWEKALKKRLLIEKTIEKDLAEGVFHMQTAAIEESENTSRKAMETDTPVNGEQEDASLDNGTSPVTSEPWKTAETTYADWIDGLEQRYAIEIDWKLWEKIEAPVNL